MIDRVRRGRPPKPPGTRYRQRHYTLPPDVANWLDGQPNASGTIAELVRMAMTVYEERATGINGETDIIVRTGITQVPAGWQNMTPETAATRAFLIGRISEEHGKFRAVSFAQQTFRRHDWEKNTSAIFDTYKEAYGWLQDNCNNTLEAI